MWKGLWGGFKNIVGDAFVFFAKSGKTYKAATPQFRSAITKGAKAKGINAASAFAVGVGTPVAAWLAYLGIDFGYKTVNGALEKVDDGIETAGAIAIFAAVVAISVGAYIVIKRGKLI